MQANMRALFWMPGHLCDSQAPPPADIRRLSKLCVPLQIVSTCRPGVFDTPTLMQLAFSHPLILEQKKKTTRCWQSCSPLSVCSRHPKLRHELENAPRMGFENYASLPRHRNPGANTKRGPGGGRGEGGGGGRADEHARNEETNRGGAGCPTRAILRTPAAPCPNGGTCWPRFNQSQTPNGCETCVERTVRLRSRVALLFKSSSLELRNMCTSGASRDVAPGSSEPAEKNSPAVRAQHHLGVAQL